MGVIWSFVIPYLHSYTLSSTLVLMWTNCTLALEPKRLLFSSLVILPSLYLFDRFHLRPIDVQSPRKKLLRNTHCEYSVLVWFSLVSDVNMLCTWLYWFYRHLKQRWTEDTTEAVRIKADALWCDVICSRLSACALCWTALEVEAGLWQAAMWFGCPCRCLTDTPGVNISHHG